jgi:hypothetical protein
MKICNTKSLYISLKKKIFIYQSINHKMYFIVYLLESLCSKGTGVSHELYVSNTGG